MDMYNFFSFASDGRPMLSTVVFSLLIGAFIAVIAMIFNSKYAGAVVRRLASKHIRTKEDACTVAELGLKMKKTYRLALRDKGRCRKSVLLANPDEAYTDGKLDFSKAKFYLPLENEEKALTLYGEKEASIIVSIIAVILLFAAAAVLLKIMPSVISAFLG